MVHNLAQIWLTLFYLGEHFCLFLWDALALYGLHRLHGGVNSGLFVRDYNVRVNCSQYEETAWRYVRDDLQGQRSTNDRTRRSG